MKYLRIDPSSTSKTDEFHIKKKSTTNVNDMPKNWTLEFFVYRSKVLIENDTTKYPLLSFTAVDPSNNNKQIKFYLTFDYTTKNENKLSKLLIGVENSTKCPSITIEPSSLNRKWNHIAIVYAEDTSLIVYINSKAVYTIDTPKNCIKLDYKDNKIFTFTVHKENIDVNITDIKFYNGIVYNTSGFAIDYPFEQNEEDSSNMKIILPPENAEEDTILPIIKNAEYVKYIGAQLSKQKFQLEFKNKDFILEDTANFNINDEGSKKIRSIGYSNEAWDAENGLTNPELPDNPEGLKIIDTEEEGIYYEIYDVKYQMPTVLKSTSDNEIAIWKDMPFAFNYTIDIITNDSFLSKKNPLFAEFSLTKAYSNTQYNTTEDTKKKAFPINISWDSENKKYTNPENIELCKIKLFPYMDRSESTINLEICGISNETVNENIDKINNDHNKLHHFSFVVSEEQCRAKVDGVDTVYIVDSKAFCNEFNSDFTINFSNYPKIYNKIHSSCCKLMTETKSNFYRYFFYLHKDKYYALFRVYEPGYEDILEGSFDPSIRCFEYPHNYEINKGINGNTEFRKKLRNNDSESYDDGNILLHYPSSYILDTNVNDYHIKVFDVYSNIDERFNFSDILPNMVELDMSEYSLFNDINMQQQLELETKYQIIEDLSPKKYYSLFVKEFDSTKEIGLIVNPDYIKQLDSSYKFANDLAEYAGITYNKLTENVEDGIFGDFLYNSCLITTSYTKERNILKFRNYHPTYLYPSVKYKIYFHIKDETDNNYYDIMYMSYLLGKGFVGFQVQPSTGSIRVITNTYYPYSTNIPKMEQIMKDKRTTIIDTGIKIKKNNWNFFKFETTIMKGETYKIDFTDEGELNTIGYRAPTDPKESNREYNINYPDAKEVTLTFKVNNYTDNFITSTDSIKINRSDKSMNYLHRLFFFMKSLNSSIIPIYKDIVVHSSRSFGNTYPSLKFI